MLKHSSFCETLSAILIHRELTLEVNYFNNDCLSKNLLFLVLSGLRHRQDIFSTK